MMPCRGQYRHSPPCSDTRHEHSSEPERHEVADTIGRVNYELYMSAALSEAKAARDAGESADGAVAVLDEAMVARGRHQVAATGDPTAHAVMMVLREAARRLGRPNLGGLVIFAANEPCAMCVGALLEADVDSVVFALVDAKRGATSSVRPATLSVVSGIMQREAQELNSPVGARRG
jgi:tRNA(adenine34) deaminase